MGAIFLRLRFANLYEAIKGAAGAAISAPFKFLEARACEFEAKGDRKTAKFYKKFAVVLFSLLFLGAIFLIGLILDWLGIDLGEGE